MAASYSSFLSSSLYSPIFNTALFDGAFRIYFSQSYESTALKIYHLVQAEYPALWTEYKKWSEKTKKNVFILIYPSAKDVASAFNHKSTDQIKIPAFTEWEDGLAVGLENTFDDEDGFQFKKAFSEIIHYLENHLNSSDFDQEEFPHEAHT